MNSHIRWPDQLITELAERRCIIFMGAGVSAGSLGEDHSTHPPDWKTFLTGALRLLLKDTDRRYAKALIAKTEFLSAAEVIIDSCDRADFSSYLREIFIHPKFAPASLHKTILEIDPKVVITTNYDLIYDNYCNSGAAKDGYNICRYYDRFAVDNLRSRVRLVIKAHGCVSDPTKIVLSRSSYYTARRDYPGFYSILDSLFLTNTLLFVGCSLSDPDIQLVLENANIAVPSAHPHYAVVEKSHHRSMKALYKNSHNVELLEYPRGKHGEATTALEDLREKVIQRRAAFGIA